LKSSIIKAKRKIKLMKSLTTIYMLADKNCDLCVFNSNINLLKGFEWSTDPEKAYCKKFNSKKFNNEKVCHLFIELLR